MTTAKSPVVSMLSPFSVEVDVGFVPAVGAAAPLAAVAAYAAAVLSVPQHVFAGEVNRGYDEQG